MGRDHTEVEDYTKLGIESNNTITGVKSITGSTGTDNSLKVTTTGYSYVDMQNKTDKIDACIRALGTMIMEPQYEPHPTEIGKKFQVQPLQRGILQGEDRVVVEKKLIELIKSL